MSAALELARAAESRRDEAELTGFLGIACSMTGQYEAASEHFHAAMAIARESNDTPQIGVLTGNLANNYLRLEECEKAIEGFEEGLRIAREVGDQENEAKWQHGLETAAQQLELDRDPAAKAAPRLSGRTTGHGAVDPEQAVELWLRAARSNRVARDYMRCGDSLANAGLLLNELRQFEEAVRRYDEALAVYRAENDQRRVGLVYLNRGVSLSDQGELERAIETLREAIELLRGATAREELASALKTLADIHSEREETEPSPLLKEAGIFRG